MGDRGCRHLRARGGEAASQASWIATNGSRDRKWEKFARNACQGLGVYLYPLSPTRALVFSPPVTRIVRTGQENGVGGGDSRREGRVRWAAIHPTRSASPEKGRGVHRACADPVDTAILPGERTAPPRTL